MYSRNDYYVTLLVCACHQRPWSGPEIGHNAINVRRETFIAKPSVAADDY